MKTALVGLAMAGLLAPAAARSADGPPEKKPKVITEDELRRSRSGGTVSIGTPDAEASPAAGEAKKDEAAAPKEQTEDERRDALRVSLQKDIDHHVANIESLQKQIDDAQKELNDNTDQTLSLPGTASGRRGALLKLIDDANAMIQQSRDALDQAEEKARREGIRVNRP